MARGGGGVYCFHQRGTPDAFDKEYDQNRSPDELQSSRAVSGDPQRPLDEDAEVQKAPDRPQELQTDLQSYQNFTKNPSLLTPLKAPILRPGQSRGRAPRDLPRRGLPRPPRARPGRPLRGSLYEPGGPSSAFQGSRSSSRASARCCRLLLAAWSFYSLSRASAVFVGFGSLSQASVRCRERVLYSRAFLNNDKI